MSTPILSMKGVRKSYSYGKAAFDAVRDFSLDIYPGEVVGLAGESGCGKTTVGKMALRLILPDEGKIEFNGSDLLALSSQEMRRLRQRMQIVLQDPYGSLNPRMTVAELVAEGLHIHRLPLGKVIEESIDAVRLPRNLLLRRPHELSGGQRQRVNLARALALRPEFLVLDESLSALDITHQQQIIELLRTLRDEQKLSYLFISHDLSVLKALSNRIGVMYRGKLVEIGPADEVIGRPRHPYTQALVASIPIPDPDKEKNRPRLILAGDPPSIGEVIRGCQFHPRCPHARALCNVEHPPFDGRTACHYPL